MEVPKYISNNNKGAGTIACVSTRLIPYITSHNLYTEGYGRKCHIGYYNDGKPLCGMNHSQYDTTDAEVSKQWIETGLFVGEVCKRCAKKALSIIEASENGC